jgi:hypothetical protein
VAARCAALSAFALEPTGSTGLHVASPVNREGRSQLFHAERSERARARIEFNPGLLKPSVVSFITVYCHGDLIN